MGHWRACYKKQKWELRQECPLLGISGSPGRIRTADKVVNSHLLYRLSYRGLVGALTKRQI